MVPQVNLLRVGDLEIWNFHERLPVGAQASLREKFAESQQAAVLEAVVNELSDGSLYLGAWEKGEIQITGLRAILSNRYFTLILHAVLFPPKNAGDPPVEGTYWSFRWNAGPQNGSATLPIDENGMVALIAEFRHALRGWRINAPRGMKRPGETLADAARREAREERGVVATDRTQTVSLGAIDPDSGILNSEPGLFALTGVNFLAERMSRDVSESSLRPVALSPEELYVAIVKGEITDAFTLALVLKAQLFGLIPPPDRAKLAPYLRAQ